MLSPWRIVEGNYTYYAAEVKEYAIDVTTANYPDIMMPVYNCSAWTAWFFVAYVVIPRERDLRLWSCALWRVWPRLYA